MRPTVPAAGELLLPPDPPGIVSSVAFEALSALAAPLERAEGSVRSWLEGIPRRHRVGIVRTRVELVVGALRG